MADKKFTYADYEDDDVTKSALERYNTLSASKPTLTDTWSNTLNDLTNKVLNREKFSYDLNGDALYQQYKDQYTNQGRLAMADTIGQASAMTGGYGNSYAATAGNQAYQGYLQQLNDRVPELYQLALDKYNQEGQDLYNQYSLVSDRSNTEYNRYRDSVADWQYDTGVAYDDYWNNRNFGYGKYSDERDLAYTEHRNGIADEQTAFENALRAAETAASLGDFSKLKALGYDTTKAEEAYKASTSGGGGDGGGNYQLSADAWNDITARCDTYIANGDSTGLKNYLKGLYNRGYITEDEYADIYEQFVPKVGNQGGGGSSKFAYQTLN